MRKCILQFSMAVLMVVTNMSFGSVVSEYLFETDNGSAVGADQFTTTNSVIDDSVGNNDGTVHMPTDGGYALRYRLGYDSAPESKTYAMHSYAQNYGTTDRWVELGQGTFDALGSFSVDCWVNLLGVYNYLYRDEKVWHFDDENGQGTFDVHIGATTITTIPDKVEFRHIDSEGTEYLVSIDWTTNNTTWVHLVAEYDMAAKQLKLTKTDSGGSPVVATIADASGESLGDGTGADWHYYLMGGQSLNGYHYYGAVDDVIITDIPPMGTIFVIK